jgi:hypothetical protein
MTAILKISCYHGNRYIHQYINFRVINPHFWGNVTGKIRDNILQNEEMTDLN